jgi:kumamolisin
MSPLSRRFLAPLFALSLASGSLALPVAHMASAAETRVVVAGATTLPATAMVVAQPMTTNFDVALTLKNPSGLNQFLNGLTNSASPLYRHFLTPAQFAARFGSSWTTINSVRSYLARFGLRVRALNSGRSLLEMSGRTTGIARAFATPVETVLLKNGSRHAQFAHAATLPASIARDVTAVAGLSSVVTPTPHLLSSARSAHVATVTVAGTCASAQSSGNNSPNVAGGYTVQQQAQLYGLSSAWTAGKTGVGQTVAIYELGQYDPTDAANFFSCYGLKPAIKVINVDGGTTGGFSDEATMDVEAVGALAPGANIEIYQAPNQSVDGVDLYAQIANRNSSSIVSTSWGDCEIDPSGTIAAEHVIFEQMAAQGQTIIAAAGDSGSSDCTGIVSNAPAVDDPASQPFVTGVGGLSVASIASPVSESVWNANGGASGGGISQIWSRPAWQKATGITAAQTMRMVPDLSVMGDPGTGFMQNFTGKNTGAQNWSSIGGTSIGAPLVSALVAVAAQVCGTSRLGFLNPTLYALARTSKGFVDVTSGNNDLFGTGDYSAGVGYDMASGLGSPDATFVNDLCPSAVSVAKSSLVSYTKTPYAGAPSHLSVALRDANGNPVVNSAVTLIAHASSGRILFDSDPTSARGHSALDSVSSDFSGHAAFTLTSTQPGRVTLTLKLHGTILYTTTLHIHAIPLTRQKPVAPTITHVVARSKGAVISVAPQRPHTPFVVALQLSVDGGRAWHSFPARARSIVVSNLKGLTTYVLHLRAHNVNGYSPVSPPIRIRTLR